MINVFDNRRKEINRYIFLTDEEKEFYDKERQRFLNDAFHKFNPRPDEPLSNEFFTCIEKIRETSGYLTNSSHKYFGSNLFNIIFLNQIGLKTATLSELASLSLDDDLYKIDDSSVNVSAVLLTGLDEVSFYPNNLYIAKEISSSIGIIKVDQPTIVEGLELFISDNFSRYGGLCLRKGKETQVFEVPDFNSQNMGRKFSRINFDYSIEWDDKGDKEFYFNPYGRDILSGIGILPRFCMVYCDQRNLNSRHDLESCYTGFSRGTINDYV
jgi:hypothetical protein